MECFDEFGQSTIQTQKINVSDNQITEHSTDFELLKNQMMKQNDLLPNQLRVSDIVCLFECFSSDPSSKLSTHAIEAFTTLSSMIAKLTNLQAEDIRALSFVIEAIATRIAQ
jgi:hypothetical protein